MLPRQHRLDYSSFAKEKYPEMKKSFPLFFYHIKKSPKSKVKILIIISKRVAKLSTIRNKTKRIISEAVYPLLTHLKPGVWISIRPKKIMSSLKSTQNTLLADLTALNLYDS
ncbi:hypothetical protein A2773_05455 [Candidatus Gottesmanbacteria bacterium RIFCSPHIGHO2_01_FULL_39_10]|uniref:Uncharacterized protein n=1 Tax=Candidatus Gottesmanbacteria bacterium RIFCSPHIGHO2_01_FULL_39_10 TaxID=1798375 RepID=A0A1F5ZQX1_9BACT|nr:MAG: hypothetical protein A2773_05455 [Candidatus Gottesmanbacteria bacterium RIFCSPHIGHO2_01_FULL_39_10]